MANACVMMGINWIQTENSAFLSARTSAAVLVIVQDQTFVSAEKVMNRLRDHASPIVIIVPTGTALNPASANAIEDTASMEKESVFLYAHLAAETMAFVQVQTLARARLDTSSRVVCADQYVLSLVLTVNALHQIVANAVKDIGTNMGNVCQNVFQNAAHKDVVFNLMYATVTKVTK